MRSIALWLFAVTILALCGACRARCVRDGGAPERMARGAPDAVAPAKPRTIDDYREAHVAALFRGIDDPDTIVDWAYVTALLEAMDQDGGHGFGRGFTKYGPILSDEEQERIGSAVHRALPRKRGPALIAAIDTAARLQWDRGPAFREAVLRAWPDTETNMREWLLSQSWPTLRDPRFTPLLRHEIERLREHVTPWHVDDVPTLALKRLVDLEPEEARAIVLTDIARKAPRYGGVALTALPDEHLDAVDANFRRPVEELTHWSFDMEKHARLAERYGGPETLAVARKLLDMPGRGADTRLLRIVMRHDREDAFRRMAKALATRDPKEPHRHRMVLREVLASNWIGRARYWDDDAAAFVRGYLDDPDERVASDAAALLKDHEAR
ncbi:MAG: hypothetical protein QNJ98_07740 [Planctomycetota bacterium]|nr:hypothetical protein [Planctomycetota bacterium]